VVGCFVFGALGQLDALACMTVCTSQAHLVNQLSAPQNRPEWQRRSGIKTGGRVRHLERGTQLARHLRHEEEADVHGHLGHCEFGAAKRQVACPSIPKRCRRASALALLGRNPNVALPPVPTLLTTDKAPEVEGARSGAIAEETKKVTSGNVLGMGATSAATTDYVCVLERLRGLVYRCR
jgi:hypothetical protein